MLFFKNNKTWLYGLIFSLTQITGSLPAPQSFTDKTKNLDQTITLKPIAYSLSNLVAQNLLRGIIFVAYGYAVYFAVFTSREEGQALDLATNAKRSPLELSKLLAIAGTIFSCSRLRKRIQEQGGQQFLPVTANNKLVVQNKESNHQAVFPKLEITLPLDQGQVLQTPLFIEDTGWQFDSVDPLKNTILNTLKFSNSLPSLSTLALLNAELNHELPIAPSVDISVDPDHLWTTLAPQYEHQEQPLRCIWIHSPYNPNQPHQLDQTIALITDRNLKPEALKTILVAALIKNRLLDQQIPWIVIALPLNFTPSNLDSPAFFICLRLEQLEGGIKMQLAEPFGTIAAAYQQIQHGPKKIAKPMQKELHRLLQALVMVSNSFNSACNFLYNPEGGQE